MSKSNQTTQPHSHFGLWILASLTDSERWRLVFVRASDLGAVTQRAHAETAANTGRLREYSAELLDDVVSLLLTDDLDDEGELFLATKLIELHGPATLTTTLVSGAREFAGAVEIDRAANVVRYARVPVAVVRAMVEAGPDTRH